MHFILYHQTQITKRFWPLTRTRSISDLRIGIDSISDKWRRYLHCNVEQYCDDDLKLVYHCSIENDNFIVAGHVLPTKELCAQIAELNLNTSLTFQGKQLAWRLDSENAVRLFESGQCNGIGEQVLQDCLVLEGPWNLFQWNEKILCEDFKDLVMETNAPSNSNRILGKAIYVAPTAKIECSILNAETGPIYIDDHAEIMEGSMIRGPFYLGKNAQLKMGAKVYGATSIGPGCKVGGEVSNSIFQANSNKAHDGFVGNSLIGEWCNLGADSNTSNLKNNYDEVKVWSYLENRFIKTGTIFCGLTMGDHAKCGINTMFNTGTVVGVGANVFGDGFPRQFIPDFAWGGAAGFSTFLFEKFVQTARTVMSRRNQELSDQAVDLLKQIYHSTKQFRSWEE